MPESRQTKMLRWKFNLFPAYVGTGARVTYIADDFSEIQIKLPLTWRTRNYVGTIFGGSMYAAIDPMYMVMLIQMLGRDYVVWDKAATINFKRPGRTTLYAKFAVVAAEVAQIKTELMHDKSIEKIYQVELVDDAGKVHAKVEKTIYIARKARNQSVRLEMPVRNVHERLLQTPLAAAGELIDKLAARDDVLWPRERWPAMRFDRPLGVGARGGHGPIRYFVEAYEPGRQIRFRFTAPRGFDGTHGFDLEEVSPGVVRLRHVLEMRVAGVARLSWPLVFRWLHDALIEDALDRAENFGQPSPIKQREWSWWVCLLRRVLSYLKSARKSGARRSASPRSGV
ncbi:hypothetical protein BH18ACI2_BH18ACI2_00910 [soil metagenome]